LLTYYTGINESGVEEHATNGSSMTVSESDLVPWVKMDKYHTRVYKSQKQLTVMEESLLGN
jgi:hypothetical protein